MKQAPAETILTYPPGQPDAVTIVDEDMARLQPDQCLNDSLIEFWLRFWHRELLAPEKRSRVHVFNTFFYHTLSSSGNMGLEKVLKWTKKLNIFSYDYLIIPINEGCGGNSQFAGLPSPHLFPFTAL